MSLLLFLFFFFKQMTAYEMRISDWSSDVCSSDLGFGELFRWLSYQTIGTSTIQSRACAVVARGTYIFALPGSTGAVTDAWEGILASQLDSRHKPCNFADARSEEHTSELQSLMRISYAVFCLQKKKHKNKNQHSITYEITSYST